MTEVIFLHIPKTGGTYIARNDDVIKPIWDLNHSAFASGSVINYPPNPGYINDMKKETSILKVN